VPLYEFVCLDCGVRTDVRASLAKKEAGLVVPCESCGGEHTRQALTAFAVRGQADARATAAASAPAPTGCGGGCACNC
jgi:putative FmdB family regulatory protein